MIIASILLLAGLAGAVSPPATLAVAGTGQAVSLKSEGRESQALDSGWRFSFGETDDAPAAADYADNQWEQVQLPHSWNRLGSYGDTRSSRTDNRQGIGWYRLKLRAPRAEARRRFYLDFGAVSKIADIWVNGVHVGTHKGAFARFRIDVSDHWKPGEDNVIAVRADNSKPVAGSATAQILPLAGDFFVHGGIYRAVSLLSLHAASFDPLDYGGPGLYARTVSVGPASAKIAILARLRNQDRSHHALQWRTRIIDAAGQVVAEADRRIDLPHGPSAQAIAIDLPYPHLWNGTADPYLYRICSDLHDGRQILDSVSQPLGVRSFRIDADKGFFLNGDHLALHGVSRHQDRPDVGWALTPKDHAQDMAIAREMGANSIRQAHYQQADEWSDEADRAGMVTWAELPYVTSPSVTGGEGSPETWANAEQQLRELIRQNYNHPSIMMWSVGNEVDSAKGFAVGKAMMQPLALLERMNAIAKHEDPYRPTIFADCCEDLTLVKTAGEKLAGTTDLIGYNRYYGWYYPQPLNARAQLGAQLDHFHAKHPTLPLSLSEYGAGGAISQHSDNIADAFLNFTGTPHPEEYQAWYHEQNWPAIRDRPFVFASWVWNLFDFASDLRREGDSIDLNNKGLVTADRRTRKDAFYYYQAQWSSKPMLHLTGKRYVERAYRVVTIKAYTNAASADLILNGRAQGSVPCPGGICLWPGIGLQPGPNQITANASLKGMPLTDVMTLDGPDPAKGIYVNAGDMGSATIAGHRYGSDDFVTGGIAAVLNMGGFAGQRMMAPRSVETDIPGLYDYWREGENFSYKIPVPKGRWTVTIYSFEPRKSLSEPVLMAVRANGREALSPFNVAHEAGGPMRGLAKSFDVVVKDGMLQLDFAGTQGRAVVAAIAVTPR